MTFLGQVLGSQGDPAEQPGRSCYFWTHPVVSGNFPGSWDRIPTITFTYSLPIKTCTMTVYTCHSPHSRAPFTHQAQPTAVPLHCLRAFTCAVCSAGGVPSSSQLPLILQESPLLMAPMRAQPGLLAQRLLGVW